MHGGAAGSGGQPGNINSVVHGLYSSALTAAEREEWVRIPLGSVDDELRILRLRLKRVLDLEATFDRAENDDERQKLLEIEKVESASFDTPKGNVRKVARTRTRPDFRRLILSLTRRIADLEATRRMLNEKGGGTGTTVQFIIER
jgi:hypothetical protein